MLIWWLILKRSLPKIEQVKACPSEMALQGRVFSCFDDLLGYNVNCAVIKGLKARHASRALPSCDSSHKMAEPD